MKTWEIWSEGYIATGNCSTATYHGSIEASTFQEACDKFSKQLKNYEFFKYYDSKSLTYWGCKLFDNENDARKYFG